MRIARWINRNRMRLSVRIERNLSARTLAIDDLPWKCTIRGYPDRTELDPYVFIVDEDGQPAESVAYGATPDAAYDGAVRGLAGLKANIVDGTRDVIRRFPNDIRP